MIVGLNVTLSDIFRHICNWKSSCNLRPDVVPSVVVLKSCIRSICLPLLVLLMASLDKGICPKLWENSYVIFIFQMQWASFSIISSQQHSFYVKRSALSNLVEYQSFLNGALSKRVQLDTVYIRTLRKKRLLILEPHKSWRVPNRT